MNAVLIDDVSNNAECTDKHTHSRTHPQTIFQNLDSTNLKLVLSVSTPSRILFLKQRREPNR